MEKLRLFGSEYLKFDGRSVDVRVNEFWSWIASDLSIDPYLQWLAEFLVLKSLKLPTETLRKNQSFQDRHGIHLHIFSRKHIAHSVASDPLTFGHPINLLRNESISDPFELPQPGVFIFAIFSPTLSAAPKSIELNQWRFTAVNARLFQNWKRVDLDLATLQKFGGFIQLPNLARPIRDSSAAARFLRFHANRENTTFQVARTDPARTGASTEWTTFRSWSRRLRPHVLWSMQQQAFNDPNFFRVCSACGERVVTGEMFDASLCRPCAKEKLGDSTIAR